MRFRFWLTCLIISLGCFAGISSFAQSEKVWVFGNHAGLDFNTGTPVPITSNISGFGEGQASVCDNNGQLLFYTEGSFVWDRNGNLMPNGSDLTGVNSVTPYSATSSTSQGALIISKPGTASQYYVFSLTSMEQNSTNNAGKLFYSVVDMSLNNGLGDVVQAEKGIQIGSNLSERMAAVVGTHCDIWVVVCSRVGSQHILAYEITNDSVSSTPVESNVGLDNEFTGYFAFSPNGDKLAGTTCFEYGNGVLAGRLFDFDVTTGTASNAIDLLPGKGGYGVCFSPDNSKLYINVDFSKLYQIDLNAGNPAAIQASAFLLGDASMTGIKRGPDGKIYFNADPGGSHLSTIGQPNAVGTATQISWNSLNLASGTMISSGFPNDVPLFDFSLDTSTSYAVQYATCLSDDITLHPVNPGGWGYQWSNGTTGTSANVTTPGLYTVRYYSEPCTYHFDSFMVYFPVVGTQNNCNEVENGSAWFTPAPGDNINYQVEWTDNNGQVISNSDTISNVPAGTYFLHVTNNKGCDVTQIVTISNNRFDASFLMDSIVCQGNQVHFTNTSNANLQDFQWDFGDGGTSTQVSPTYTFVQGGNYQVSMIASSGDCKDTVVKSIIVDSRASASFEIVPQVVCQGDFVTFTPQPDSTATTYVWNFGDENGISESRDIFRTHAFDQPGLMHVTLTGHFRVCPDTTATDTVRVYPLPNVYLGPDSVLCLGGDPIYLKNLAPDPTEVFHRYWNTGDTTAILRVGHPGIYSLTVETQPAGCSLSESVTVRKDCYIDVPNAFTPNGDGENDYFFPRQLLSKNLTAFQMTIYNRWGQKIFETNRTDGRGWDGRFNGKDQPNGVYVYVIDAVIAGDRPQHYQGNVTLIR